MYRTANHGTSFAFQNATVNTPVIPHQNTVKTQKKSKHAAVIPENDPFPRSVVRQDPHAARRPVRAESGPDFEIGELAVTVILPAPATERDVGRDVEILHRNLFSAIGTVNHAHSSFRFSKRRPAGRTAGNRSPAKSQTSAFTRFSASRFRNAPDRTHSDSSFQLVTSDNLDRISASFLASGAIFFPFSRPES